MKLPNWKNQNTKIITILCILFILAGASFFDYSYMNNRHSNISVNSMVKKANDNLSLTLYNKLNDTELILTSLAMQASAYDNIKDPIVLEVLYKQSKADNYLNLFITTPDAITTYALNSETEDSSDESFFQEVMQGNVYISKLRKSRFNNTDIIIMSVPIWKNNQVVGALSSSIDINMFVNILNMSLDENEQDAMIIQPDGTILAKTSGITSHNLFSQLNKAIFEEDKTLKEIQLDFQEQKTNKIHYKINNNEYLAYYCPIKNSDWFILTALPYHIVNAQVQNVFKYTIQFALKMIVLLIVALVVISYYERKGTKQIRVVNNQLDAIIDNTPGCFIMYEYHNHTNIRFLNDEFFNLSGYTKKEFIELFENDLFKIIQVDDLATLRNKVHLDIADKQDRSLSYNYRMVHKNGDIVWVMDRRHLVKDAHGIQWFYITLIDITELKTMQERLLISQQRYKMIIDQTESVVFEWDVQRDTISFSDLWKDKFGYELEYADFLTISTHYTNNEQDSYIPLLEDFIKGKMQGQLECKLKKADGHFIWCKITARAINDSFGYLLSVYGSIEDIDIAKSKTLMLEEKSMIDGLTKIYNKETGENEIKKALIDFPLNQHILLVVDIDDFKKVNDTLGHVVGDNVLAQLGNVIKECFREQDIVTRFGGDEFVAFMKNVDNFSHEALKQKVNRLHRTISSIQVDEIATQHITCSIGISVYPKDGDSYHDLFVNADKALYNAKHSGKNQYCISKQTNMLKKDKIKGDQR